MSKSDITSVGPASRRPKPARRRFHRLEFLDESMSDEAITRHFFNGFIRLHVLYHAVKEPVYGAEIAEELVRHGYRVSQGTLYPTFHLLERLGYLSSQEEVVDGRRRKYYRATAAGRKILGRARKQLLELVAEVVEDNDQPFQAIRQKRRDASGKRR